MIKYISIFFFLINLVSGQQISIPRVESMPNIPQPYEMRDWKNVTMGYDSLVFNLDLTGTYLPLIWINNSTVNYPEHSSFGLHTAVGTNNPGNGEGINILPAVVGASLIGIDKSNQKGYNWTLFCEEFFNRRPVENIYLNGTVSSSGNDWWYDTMPNIFFYQLNYLYPGTGDFQYQFVKIADRWLEAVKHMGGSTTPWKVPYMNYRAFRLATMLPNPDGVKQPEAAGAIGWLLYNAYKELGDEKYRIGAEWCLEFLSNWSTNPSYELQLPYGAYAAARMNAEIGTSFNINKILNWCFSPDGNIRNWGVTLGNWGGYDCDGLVGEARYDGYAFIMNGFQQAAALVPMVRYDDRYARAIGKWVLNLANASRLFYTKFLPDYNQDGENWAKTYDPNSYIAHEALREKDINSDARPFATGDFLRSGWGATNFALYGSSHVGYLAGIVDTTNVPMVLELDVLKTDFYSDLAYATFLYYNPYSRDTNIVIYTGEGIYDIYDAVSNSFLESGVTGSYDLSLPSDAARMIVLVPSGGNVRFEYNKMLVNNITVDYNSGQTVDNRPPRIKSLSAKFNTMFLGDSTTVYCTTTDPDGDDIDYLWITDIGNITGSGENVMFVSPNTAGTARITCIISDPSGLSDTSDVLIEIRSNHNPEIKSLRANPEEINVGDSTSLYCNAVDLDNDSLIYDWQCVNGTFSGAGSHVIWEAPDLIGIQTVYCSVYDGRGGQTIDSINVFVGTLVGLYHFNGNANDSSGYENHGEVSGPLLVPDRFGSPNSAYIFDGIDDYISIAQDLSLNFNNAITVNFWIRVDEFFDREAYPISHGNWENRWKISITNERIRWTIKTDTLVNNGIKDLDSQSKLQLGKYYNVCAIYDRNRIEIYFDGELNAKTTWGGKILSTPINLLIGQALPGNSAYNFKGIMDDIRIYNKGLTATQVKELYESATQIPELYSQNIPQKFELYQNYPNPFNPSTVISWQLAVGSKVELNIYNILGKKMTTLVLEEQKPGFHQVEWDASGYATGVYYYKITAGEFNAVEKMILIR